MLGFCAILPGWYKKNHNFQLDLRHQSRLFITDVDFIITWTYIHKIIVSNSRFKHQVGDKWSKSSQILVKNAYFWRFLPCCTRGFHHKVWLLFSSEMFRNNDSYHRKNISNICLGCLSTTDFPSVPICGGILFNSPRLVLAKSQLSIRCATPITFIHHRC